MSPQLTLSDEALASLSCMEGVVVPLTAPAPAPHVQPSSAMALGLAIVLAAISYAMHYLPFAPFAVPAGEGIRRPISAAVIAIILGILARNLLPLPSWAASGSRVVVRKALPVLIILAGAGLDIAQILGVGLRAFGIVLLCVAGATVSALYIGKLFGLTRRSALLIGSGTAICGTSAILALAPTLEAEDDEITLSAAVVNILGLVLMFLLPVLGGLIHMTDQGFGIWAGASIHAVPQAVAAGFAFSQSAGTLATLVKLIRVGLLAPYAIVITAIWVSSRKTGKRRIQMPPLSAIPNFLWGFALVAMLTTFKVLPDLRFHPLWSHSVYSVSIVKVFTEFSNALLTIVMAGLGLEVGVASLARVGRPAVVTGGLVTCVMCGMAWILIALFI